MNTRVELFIAASLIICATHQPVLAAKPAAVSSPASDAVTVATIPTGAPITPIAHTAAAAVAATPVVPSIERGAPSVHTGATTAPATSQNLDLKHIVKGTLDKDLPVLVIVDKQKHFTHVLQLQNDVVTEVLCVQNSTGKPSTPTPEGRAVITQKQLDPVWVPPVSIDPKQRAVPPWSKTHLNPLGVANLRLSIDGGMIALHGTNEPSQIGKNVSHGCIRHRNADILKVAAIVQKGTPVYIVPSMDRATIPVRDAAPLTVTVGTQYPNKNGRPKQF